MSSRMGPREHKRLEEIELKLQTLKQSFDFIFVVWNQVDRKRLSLMAEMKNLEDERLKLTQGQLTFGDPGFYLDF